MRPGWGILALASLIGSCGLDFNREGQRCEPSGGWLAACQASGAGECAEGLTCDRGVCELNAPGRACLRTFDCGSGSGLICRERRCVDPAELSGRNAICRDRADCKPGLTCSWTGQDKRCVPLYETNFGCNESSDCFEGQYCCVGAGCLDRPNRNGRCLPKLGRGESCLLTDACLPGWVCTQGLVCDDAPNEGQPCLDRCAPNLVCEWR